MTLPQTAPRIIALFGAIAFFGQERGNVEALAALQEQGCEVLCLVRPEAWSATVRDALTARGLRWRKTPFIVPWMPDHALYFFSYNAFSFAAANFLFAWLLLRFKPTHIYAFNNLYVLNFLPALTVFRTPLVYRAGDPPILHNRFFRWLWSAIVRRTQHFVANSKFIKDQLIATGAAPGRITIIHNKAPRRNAPDDKLDLAGSNPDEWRILYVGQLIALKGVHILIEAFSRIAPQFPRARLLIAGRISAWSGDQWARDLREEVETDLVLARRVSFLGHVENTLPLYRSSHIHVCPSIMEEGWANVVIEAKSAGLASIVFASGGLSEMVEDDVDGIVCAEKSAESLANALAVYASDPERAMRHGQAASASLQRFNVARFNETWRGVIDRCAQA